MRNAYKKIGTLYGVGIGPGDPELVTLKAVNILKKADFIFAPKPNIESTSMAADIIKNHIQNKDKVREIIFSMTKDKKILSRFWKEAALKVYKELSLGKDAAFVTIGDPFIYSTYIYLLRHIRKLNRDLKIITIPGISAINAASSLLEIPLAEAEERFAVIPLPKRLADLKLVFKQFDTVVLLKIGKNLKNLVSFLKKEGLSDCAYFTKRIGCPEQYMVKGVDKLNLNEKTLGYLSTMLVKIKKKRDRK